MDFDLDSLNNPYLPIWLVVLAGLIKLFQKDIAIFIPTAIREYFAAKEARVRDRQEHRQEIEEVNVEARLQSDVTAQLQLIQVNKRLVDFLTEQTDQRLSELERITREIRDLVRDGQANHPLIQIEWSRISDALSRTEMLLSRLEASLDRARNE